MGVGELEVRFGEDIVPVESLVGHWGTAVARGAGGFHADGLGLGVEHVLAATAWAPLHEEVSVEL